MKKYALISIAAIVALSGATVRAQSGEDSITLSEYQISLVRENCEGVQSILKNVHSSDALARVHLGQEYETILTKFMAPMNSRVALSKLDGVALAKTTVDFTHELEQFRSEYQAYDQTIARAVQMKCKEQPTQFYDAIVEARERREKLHDSVETLSGLVGRYRAEIGNVQKQVKTKQNGGKVNGN